MSTQWVKDESGGFHPEVKSYDDDYVTIPMLEYEKLCKIRDDYEKATQMLDELLGD